APFSNPFVEKRADDEWLTDRLTDDAISFMKENKGGPFFVNLHYYTVHQPVISRSDELVEKYMAKDGDETLGQGVGNKDKKLKAAAYASMIESLDDNFGRMVDFLEESGLDKNTIIVFSSDNGYNFGANNLLRGKKRDIYEGGVRVPTFIYWPGKSVARRTKISVSVLDYFPTFLDLAGINDYKGTLDGNSIKPLLTSDDEAFKERPIFWQISSRSARMGTCTAVRQGKYKAIQFLATGEVEVYDLENDPMESKNLAKTNKAIAGKFAKQMSEWRVDNNVPMPGDAVVR
ncbi:MAG: sulfatase-like hydrolase/transferase, partial [Rikenellaceae bacterium]